MELRRKRAATPQKSSRFQPTEPLHMTTRAASKAASVGSNSGSSRRGSLISNGQISPLGGNEIEGDRYPKRRRVSTGSKSTPARAVNSSQSSSTASRPSTRSMSGGNLHPIAESPIPTKKRKRSSAAIADYISVARPLRIASGTEGVLESLEQTMQLPEKAKRASYSPDEEVKLQFGNSDTNDPKPAGDESRETEAADIETAKPSDHSQRVSESAANDDSNGKEEKTDTEDSVRDPARDYEEGCDQQHEGGSSDGKQPSDDGQPRDANMQESIENANGVYEAEQDEDMMDEDGDADAEGEFNEDDAEIENSRDESTVPGVIGTTTLDPTPAVSAAASPSGSLPDSTADQESPMKRFDALVGGEGAMVAGDGDKPIKRLPGRRRAPHPNSKVEAALRRQLHLRMTYRAVAKNLKPILAELAKRSLNNLHDHPKAHLQSSEYPGVKEDLLYHYEQRLAWIQKQKELNKTRLNDILQEQTEMRRRQHEHVARTIQEDFAVRLQHDFLNTLRKQQQGQDDDYSDDEADDVIPPLRRVTRKGGVGNILGPEYHWRSRPAMETERLFNELQERDQVAKQHQDHDKESALEDCRPFTTFDPVLRDAAKASRKIDELMYALEDASREPVVNPPPAPPATLPPPVISNGEATGLQLLAMALDTARVVTPAISGSVATEQTIPPVDEIKQEDLSVPRPSLSRTESQATPAPPSHTPAQQEPGPEQRPPTTAPISFSQAVLEPSIKETAPLITRPSMQFEQQDQPRLIPGLTQLPRLEQMVSERPQENMLSQVQPGTMASLPAPTPSKPAATDFWSSLARGNYETDAHGKVKLAPKASAQQTQSISETANKLQEPSNAEDRGSRPSLPSSSTILEPLSQRLRSTSDSFGPLLDRPGQMDNSRAKKGPAPKKSLYGPWPRSRNYNPLDRRASTAGPGTQDTLPGIHSRSASVYGGGYSSPEVRHPAYAPHPLPQLPGFSPSAPQTGTYLPAPMYSTAPPPPPSFAYDQRGQAYQQAPPPMGPYQGPTGFSSLPGAPITQGPPQYYGAPHGLPPPPPPPQQAAGYPPTALTSRPPPTPPAYGSQYGGQPILPAGHDPRYGQSGAPPAAAGPAFAQYQQHDGRRRRNQSLGHREFQHYHGPRQ